MKEVWYFNAGRLDAGESNNWKMYSMIKLEDVNYNVICLVVSKGIILEFIDKILSWSHLGGSIHVHGFHCHHYNFKIREGVGFTRESLLNICCAHTFNLYVQPFKIPM